MQYAVLSANTKTLQKSNNAITY